MQTELKVIHVNGMKLFFHERMDADQLVRDVFRNNTDLLNEFLTLLGKGTIDDVIEANDGEYERVVSAIMQALCQWYEEEQSQFVIPGNRY